MKTVASAANIEIVEKSSPSKNSPDGFFHSTSQETIEKAYQKKKKEKEKENEWFKDCPRCVIL